MNERKQALNLVDYLPRGWHIGAETRSSGISLESFATTELVKSFGFTKPEDGGVLKCWRPSAPRGCCLPEQTLLNVVGRGCTVVFVVRAFGWL